MKKRTVMYTVLWLFPLICIGIYFLFFNSVVAVVAFFTFWMYMLFVFAILTRSRWDAVRNQPRSQRSSFIGQLKNIVLFVVSVCILLFIVLVLLAYAVAYY
jgi:ABC-type glycerol-3-phosphate transport system permease component